MGRTERIVRSDPRRLNTLMVRREPPRRSSSGVMAGTAGTVEMRRTMAMAEMAATEETVAMQQEVQGGVAGMAEMVLCVPLQAMAAMGEAEALLIREEGGTVATAGPGMAQGMEGTGAMAGTAVQERVAMVAMEEKEGTANPRAPAGPRAHWARDGPGNRDRKASAARRVPKEHPA